MTNEYPIASDRTRREHSRWLRRRDTWRRQYREISNSIRAVKSILKVNSYDRFAQITLISLRDTADDMMEYREDIRQGLCKYSYPYAPREVVDLVMKGS